MKCTRCKQTYEADKYEVCPARGAPWGHTQFVQWYHEPTGFKITTEDGEVLCK